MTTTLTTIYCLCYPEVDLIGTTITTLNMEDSDDDASSLTNSQFLAGISGMSDGTRDLLDRAQASITAAQAEAAARKAGSVAS